MSYANLHSFNDLTYSEDEYEESVKPNSITLMPVFGENYIKRLFVIVETYEHKNYGRGKREYMKQFTKSERKTISKYYAKIYRWYLVTGIPHNGVRMSLNTYELLCRASDFFATI